MLRIKLIKSPIGNTKRNRATVAALGLRKMHREKLVPDNPSIRGMIHHVKHLLHVEEVEGVVEAPAKKAPAKKAEAPVAEAPKAAKPKAESKADDADAKPAPKKRTTKKAESEE